MKFRGEVRSRLTGLLSWAEPLFEKVLDSNDAARIELPRVIKLAPVEDPVSIHSMGTYDNRDRWRPTLLSEAEDNTGAGC